MSKDEITDHTQDHTQIEVQKRDDLPELAEDTISNLELFKESWDLTYEDIEVRRNEGIEHTTWTFRSDLTGHGSDTNLLRRDAAAAQDLYNRLAPDDPIEEMLAQEMIMAHQSGKQLLVSAARSDRTREQKFELGKEAARYIKLSHDLRREFDRHRMQKLKSQTEVQRQDALEQKRYTETLKQEKLLLEIERKRMDAEMAEQKSVQRFEKGGLTGSENILVREILKSQRTEEL